MAELSRRECLRSIAVVGVTATGGLIGCNRLTSPSPSSVVKNGAAATTPTGSLYATALLGPSGEIDLKGTSGSPTTADGLIDQWKTLADGDEIGLGLNFEAAEPREGDVRAEWSRQFPGFFVYIDRVETHPLQPCVNVPVKHFHVVVKRYSSTPDTQAWTKLHLGKYQQGSRTCYVMYDSQHRWICVPTCGRPGQGDLSRFFRDALTATLIAVGIVLTVAAIASAAEILATAALGLILAL